MLRRTEGGASAATCATGEPASGTTLLHAATGLERFLDELPVAVMVLNATGHPHYLNHAATRLLGQGARPEVCLEDLALVYRVFLTGSDQLYPVERLPIARALHGETVTVDDMDLVTSRGRIPVEVWASPILGDGGRVDYAIAAFWHAGGRRALESERASLFNEVQRRQRLQDAVGEVLGLALTAIEPDEILECVARQSRHLLAADLGAVVATVPPGAVLRIRAAHGDKADALRWATFPAHLSVIGQALAEGKVVVLHDTAADLQAGAPFTSFQIAQLLVVPLGGPGKTFGAICLGRSRGYQAFTNEDALLAEDFADRAAVAVHYVDAQQQLSRLAVLEDRERIARELHDGVIQSLYVVGMGLQAARAVVDDADALTDRLTDAVDEIDRVAKELRHYIFELRPALGGSELELRLHSLAKEFESAVGIPIATEVDRDAAVALRTRAAEVIQLAREGLANAVKHSGSKRISLTLWRNDREAILEVVDEGKGFDPHGLTTGHGLGNLRARVEALGGTLHVESAPGRGARLRAGIPLRRAREAPDGRKTLPRTSRPAPRTSPRQAQARRSGREAG